MKIILTYDSSNSNKLNLLCKKYLHWIQNSTFEGDLSISMLEEFKNKLKSIINENDSIIIFEINNPKWIKKSILGLEKNKINNIL